MDSGENNVVVPQTQDTSSTTEAAKPENTSQQSTSQSSNQDTAPVKGGQDDRRNAGILADLQRERKARQEYEQQAAQFRTELEAEKRRVQALAGVNPVSREDQERETIRQQFAQLFPHLGALTQEDIEALRDLREQRGQLEETTLHYWERHGDSMLQSVEKQIATEFGGNLSDRQISRIRAAYVHAARTDPDFLARHEAGDPKLVQEFAKEWVDDWFEPARRRVTQQEVGRQRPVPGGRDRSVTTTGGKKIDFKDPKAVEDAMVESYRSHGGAFGG